MNSYAKRNLFVYRIRFTKGNNQAKKYLIDYYTNKIPVTFFDNFSIENIERLDVKKEILEIQQIINAN